MQAYRFNEMRRDDATSTECIVFAFSIYSPRKQRYRCKRPFEDVRAERRDRNELDLTALKGNGFRASEGLGCSSVPTGSRVRRLFSWSSRSLFSVAPAPSARF
jgi:hypothetical protein